MLLRRLATLTIAILAAAACAAPPDAPASAIATAPSAAPPTTQPATASPPSPAARPGLALDGKPLVPCRLGSVTAVCGEYEVPEDPSDPTGRSIGLRVAVIPATAPDPEPDPVVMLAGGPGGAATANLSWAATSFRGIHATRDIVLVDQRGTGGSNLHLLDDLPDLTGLDDAAARGVIERWIEASLAGFDGDPRMYTTSIAMDDLDAVRAALGYDLVNLWGASYGATAAQYYLRQHGDRVRSVVLDGATLVEVPIFEWLPAASQRALDLVLARCAADDACAGAFPDPGADLAAALAALADEGVTTGVMNPADGKPVEITRLNLVGAIHGALLDASTAAALPWFLHEAAAGMWDSVASAMLAAAGGRPATADMPLMSAVIRCSEAWARWDPDETARVGAGSYLVEAQVLQAHGQEIGCELAPAGLVAPDDGEPVSSDVPVLLIVGEADPQDPSANVAAAPERFPNSLTVIVPGHGHTVSHQGCLPAIVDAFVAAGAADGLDTACVAAGGVPVPPFRLR